MLVDGSGPGNNFARPEPHSTRWPSF